MALGPITTELYEKQTEATSFAKRSKRVEDSVVRVEEEQRLLRATLERQLRSQRSALDHRALHGKHSVPGAAPTAVPERERVRGENLTEEQLQSYRGTPLLAAD